MERLQCPTVQQTAAFPLVSKTLRVACNRSCNREAANRRQKHDGRQRRIGQEAATHPSQPHHQRLEAAAIGASAEHLGTRLSRHAGHPAQPLRRRGLCISPTAHACPYAAVLDTELIYQADKIGTARNNGKEPEPALLDLFCRLVNASRRECEALGWERTARDVTMSLADYIRVDEEPGQ